MNTEQPSSGCQHWDGPAWMMFLFNLSLVFRMWASQGRGVHNPSCPPQLSGARQARDVGGNPCITALAKERERESSHFGSSAAPLLGGLCRLLASGGRCEVDPRLSTLGEPSHLSQRCLSTHTCCRFASGTLAGLGTIEPYSRRQV